MPVLRPSVSGPYQVFDVVETESDGGSGWRIARDHTTELKHDLNQQQKYKLGHKLNFTALKQNCAKAKHGLGWEKHNN